MSRSRKNARKRRAGPATRWRKTMCSGVSIATSVSRGGAAATGVAGTAGSITRRGGGSKGERRPTMVVFPGPVYFVPMLRARLPPGPRLPPAAQTALFLTRPVEFLDGCHRRYGDCFTVHTYVVGREIEIVHPDMVRQVFTGDPAVMHAGEAND